MVCLEFICFTREYQLSTAIVIYISRCIPDLALAWSREISTAPIASTPLIADVDADGDLDIVATSFSGSVHVVKAKDGLAKQTSQWPYRLNHATIHAGPLQVLSILHIIVSMLILLLMY